MIHEYALEPKLVASWHDRMRGRFFIDKFGLGTGRIVSRYPGNWKRQVWDAFNETFDGTPSEKEKARGRIEELIKQFATAMTKRSGLPGDGPNWFANAEEEHERKSFYAILARDNPYHNTGVMREGDVLEYKAKAWNVPEGAILISRTAEEMAKCVAPMLRCATKILFVDPYFRATEERFLKPLAMFLQNVDTQALKRGMIELHTKALRKRCAIELHTADRDKAPSWQVFQQECKDKLPSILPADVLLTVYRWKNREGGEKLHNRYILTDIGGVSFNTGLDEGDSGTTDDVSRLSADTYAKRWSDYAGPNLAFEPDGEPFPIEGQAAG